MKLWWKIQVFCVDHPAFVVFWLIVAVMITLSLLGWIE